MLVLERWSPEGQEFKANFGYMRPRHLKIKQNKYPFQLMHYQCTNQNGFKDKQENTQSRAGVCIHL